MDRSVEEARRLLHAHRSLADKKTSPGRVHFPFSSRDSAGYSYQEVNAVLAGVLDSDGPVEVVRALLGFGADVNFSKRRSSGALSKFSLRDGRSHRSDLLLRATIRCRAETVRLLAVRAISIFLVRQQHQADQVRRPKQIKRTWTVFSTKPYFEPTSPSSRPCSTTVPTR